MSIAAIFIVALVALAFAWYVRVLIGERRWKQAGLCSLSVALLLGALFLLSGCACAQFPPPDGPDTPQKWDADGNPNFGPR